MKDVYTIIENENLERAIWLRIGVAFVNRDESLSVILDCLPLNGRLHIRERKENQEKNEENGTG